MAGKDLRIIIKSILEQSSLQTIRNQLEEIKTRYGNLQIHINIDQKALSALTSMMSSINKITQSTQAQEKATNTVTDAVIKETKAINDLTAAQAKNNVEKQKIIRDDNRTTTSTTSGDKFNNTTSSRTVFNDGSLPVDHKETIQRIDTAGQLRANLAEQKKMLDQAYKENENFNKKVIDLDRDHYNALKSNKTRSDALDKMHYSALKQNRELDARNADRINKDFESMDRAHYNALKSNAARKEAMQKIEQIAYQRNAQINLATQRKSASDSAALLAVQNKAELQVMNLNRRYGNSVDSTGLTSLFNQLKALDPKLSTTRAESLRLSNEINKIGAAAKSSAGHSLSFGEALRGSLNKMSAFIVGGALLSIPFRIIQNGVRSVYELDTAMTNLMKVTNATSAEYRIFMEDTNKTASSLGALTVDVVNATTEWARLGYSINQAKTLAAETIVYANVGDMSAENASKALISTIKGFGVQVDAEGKNVRKVVDIYNEVGRILSAEYSGNIVIINSVNCWDNLRVA